MNVYASRGFLNGINVPQMDEILGYDFLFLIIKTLCASTEFLRAEM